MMTFMIVCFLKVKRWNIWSGRTWKGANEIRNWILNGIIPSSYNIHHVLEYPIKKKNVISFKIQCNVLYYVIFFAINTYTLQHVLVTLSAVGWNGWTIITRWAVSVADWSTNLWWGESLTINLKTVDTLFFTMFHTIVFLTANADRRPWDSHWLNKGGREGGREEGQGPLAQPIGGSHNT